jgi:hypothetical protein
VARCFLRGPCDARIDNQLESDVLC